MVDANEEIINNENILLSYSDEILSKLDNTKLNLDINVDSYSNEIYIIDYINNIFDNLKVVVENSNYLIMETKNYFDNLINNIPANIAIPEIVDLNLESIKINNYPSEVMVNLNNDNNFLVLRSNSNNEASIMGILDNNTRLMKLEDANNSNWIKVQTIDGKVGYVSRDYIKEIK